MAGTPEQRASDINTIFADPSIAAIIASHGGQVASSVLRHLDWPAIRSSPKIFTGFSNVALLSVALFARAGLVTYHGNMVIWHLGMDPTDYDLAEFRAVLMDGRTGPVAKNSAWVTVRDGPVGEGRLMGEAMALRALAGTPYQPSLEGDVVLFFEGMSGPPGVTRHNLDQLDYMGVFEQTRGVLIGCDGSAFTSSPPEVPFTDILLDVTSAYDFPVVTCNDFGHGVPNTVLPIGLPVRLDPSSSTLELLEPPVS